jgi:excisionase family DNA binding protein
MLPLMTSLDVAKRLGVSERHVQRLRRNGKGPKYMRLGAEKTVRYEPTDVEEWLETQRVSSTSEEVAAGRRAHKVKPEIEPRDE